RGDDVILGERREERSELDGLVGALVREPERRPHGQRLLGELDRDGAGSVGRPPGFSLVRTQALAQVLAADVARHRASLGKRKGGSFEPPFTDTRPVRLCGPGVQFAYRDLVRRTRFRRPPVGGFLGKAPNGKAGPPPGPALSVSREESRSKSGGAPPHRAPRISLPRRPRRIGARSRLQTKYRR